MTRANPIDDLGLEVGTAGSFEVELAHGVMLRGRSPESLDWCRARAKVAEVFDPADKLRWAAERYRLTEADRGTLADPATWEGVAEFVTAVEIACLVVKTVTRQAGDNAFAVEPSAGVFAALFKQDDNLGRFLARCREADRELIAPKKGHAPSPNTSGEAGAPTVTDAGSTGTAARGAD